MTPLIESLRGRGTGWCVAGEEMAESYVSRGDLYVFYSMDENDEAKIPRAAISFMGNQISQVRGIAADQNLDPFISPVVSEKLKEFTDGEFFQKKSQDMNRLTHIERKMNLEYSLTREDLLFLYEIHSKIEGFGKKADPRIQELREKRNAQEDVPIIFDCPSHQVAYTKEAVNQQTVVYIGEVFDGLFSDFKQLKRVYTKFPDREIQKQVIEVNEQSERLFKEALDRHEFSVQSTAAQMLEQIKMRGRLKNIQEEHVYLTVADLFGDENDHGMAEIRDKAKAAGLSLCDPMVGPILMLQWMNQKGNQTLTVAMEKINVTVPKDDYAENDYDEDGFTPPLDPDAYAFYLRRYYNLFELQSCWAEPGGGLSSDSRFVFSVRS